MSKIIDQFIEGLLNNDQIHFTTHYNKRLMEREINDSYIKNLILNEEFLDFYGADEKDTFKVVYPSEKSGYNIIIVLATKKDHIVIKTVYESKIR